jgi:peptidoglycan/xylan/chitin deacetylase (PgdA/CDA1 family)
MHTVLMYHAIPDQAQAEAGVDPHYSVLRDQFARHLELIAESGGRPASVRAILDEQVAGRSVQGWVGVTFDDAHRSNHAAAAMLRDVGGSADFFVNPSTVGTGNFCSWAQLREMADWGMSIQSHGMHHRFLDELTPVDVEMELGRSKDIIEQELGRAVTLYAPAGGRQAPGMDALAQRLGYERICSSRVGLWGDEGGGPREVPRLAVLMGTGLPQLRRWVRQSALEMAWQRGRYGALRKAKRLLGNGVYVRLRGALLRDAAR